MKLCFVMWGTSRTGGTRVILEVANLLARKGHHVTVVAAGVANNHKWFTFDERVRFRYPEAAFSVPLPTLGRVPLRLLVERALRLPYDVDVGRLLSRSIPDDTDINVATFWPTAFPVHRKNGISLPFYYMQHYEALFYNDSFTKKMVDETYTLPLNRISNSTWLQNLLRGKFKVDSLGPLIPGVDTSVFFPIRGTAESEKTVVALGKSTRWKGIWELFEALSLLRNEVVGIRLLMYGNEPWLAKYSPVPCTYLRGPSDADLAALYSSAQVVVTPSWYESSPLPPLEAMACGAPLVVTRLGTEDYCFDGVNSLVVEPRNPKMLASAIRSMLKEETLRERLRKEALATARQFTWGRTADFAESLFRDALGQSD